MSNSTVPHPARTLTSTWCLTVLVLFPILVLLGLLMRFNQAGSALLAPDRFYSLMTLHGLGFAGTLFVAGLAVTWHLLVPHLGPEGVRPGRYRLFWIGYALVLLAVTGLILAALVGRFAAGWYLLYPLPVVNVTWAGWASGLALGALMVMGSAWLLLQGNILQALIRRFGIRHLLGWHYIIARGRAAVELPPIALITGISLIAGIATTLVGAVYLSLNLMQWWQPGRSFDPLLMKNAVFLFGHTIVNITMYLGIAAVYELMPDYSGRLWPVNRLVAIAWNLTLVFVLGAYFHHLYMDFVQPESLQYAGQFFSYASSVPATVVTVFGFIAQVYRSGIRWRFVPLTFLLGFMGWVLGGLAAVVDSTIMVNYVFHNTLWVPAHFHTYFLMGYVLLFFGVVHHIFAAAGEKLARLSLALMLLGGYGFLVMFYLAGAAGVPRRFADYQAVPVESLVDLAQWTASAGGWCGLGFLFGFLGFLASLLTGRHAKPTSPRYDSR